MTKISKEIISQMKVAEIMTKNVFAVIPAITIREAIELLLDKQISGAPVVDHTQHVISVVSEADLMTLAVSHGFDTKISEVLKKLPATKDLILAKADDKFAALFAKFITKPVRRVIVIDDNGLLRGLVSRRDVLKAFLVSKEAQDAKETKTADSKAGDDTSKK